MSRPCDQLGLQGRGVGQSLEARWPGAGWRTGPAPCAGPAGRARASARTAGASHFGPPTAPNSTASVALACASVPRPAARRARRRPPPPTRSSSTSNAEPAPAEPADHAADLGHDLRTDPVAGQEKNVSDLGHGECSEGSLARGVDGAGLLAAAAANGKCSTNGGMPRPTRSDAGTAGMARRLDGPGGSRAMQPGARPGGPGPRSGGVRGG